MGMNDPYIIMKPRTSGFTTVMEGYQKRDALIRDLLAAAQSALTLIAGQHNPQSSLMLEYEECPADHPDCCGYCEIIHKVRAAILKAEETKL